MADIFGTTNSKALQGVIDAASKILMGVRDDETAKAQTEEEHPAVATAEGSDARLQMIKKAAEKVKAQAAKKDAQAMKDAKRDMKAKGATKGMADVKMDEDTQLDEISPKLARKAAAASAAKSFEYGSSAYDDESQKNADRLDKKSDKAYAHVMKRQGQRGVDKTNRLASKLIFGKSRYMESVDLDADSADKALQHDCAKHVVHKEHGEGQCIPGMHTIVETSEGEGYVTHYDVMFDHGIEVDVPVEDLEIVTEMSHGHPRKKK